MVKNKPVRIILDTNWYISHLITGRPQELDNILLDENYEIVISDKQEEEFEKVINRPGNRKYFSIDIARKYFSFIKKRSLYFSPEATINICRDAKDNYLLDLAKISGANYLVTGDGDLLELKRFENTSICTLPDFIKNHLNK